MIFFMFPERNKKAAILAESMRVCTEFLKQYLQVNFQSEIMNS